MKNFVVIAAVANLHTGIVKLTERQAKDRGHLVELVEGKKDLYNIIETITFKKGETFSCNGDINKSLLEEVGEVVDVKAKKAETDKAKKKAKESADALAVAQDRISELEEATAALNVEADERLQESLKKLEDAEEALAKAVKRAEDAEAEVTTLEEAAKDTKKDKK